MTRPVIVSHLDYFKSVWIQSALLNSIACFTDKYRDIRRYATTNSGERYNMERKTLRGILLTGLKIYTFIMDLLWITTSSVTNSLYEYNKR